jgi:excisionase family DNA binding protein
MWPLLSAIFSVRVYFLFFMQFSCKETPMGADKWLTLDELSQYLKLSTSLLYRLAQRGEIPASRIGTLWRFDRDEVDAWMKRRQTGVNDSNDSND